MLIHIAFVHACMSGCIPPYGVKHAHVVQERLADLIAEHICRCPEPHQIEELLRDSRVNGEDGKEIGQRKMDYVRKLAIQI